MLLSPLLIETYFEIAEQALDLAIFEPEKAHYSVLSHGLGKQNQPQTMSRQVDSWCA